MDVMATKRHGPKTLLAWSAAIAAMPLAFSVSTQLKLIPFAMLFVSGIYLWRTDAFARACLRRARWPLLSMLAVMLYAIANVVMHRLDHRPLGLPLQTVLFLAIAAVFTTDLRRALVWNGFALAGLVLGATAIVQVHGLKDARAYGLNGGDWSAIEFGMCLLALVFLSVNTLLRGDLKRYERALHGVAVVVGLYGAILSMSRGPLLSAILVLLAMAAVYLLRGDRVRGRRRRILGFGGTLLILAFAMVANRQILDRFEHVEDDVRAYAVEGEVEGAVSERLEMWRVSYRAFAEKPVFGIGIGQFGQYVRRQVDAGMASPQIRKYTNSHSEYIETAATGGIVGLLLLLLQFLVPLHYFARRAFLARDDYALAVACSGMCVVLLYSLCALTDNVFYRAMPNSLYFFLVAGLAAHLASLGLRGDAKEQT